MRTDFLSKGDIKLKKLTFNSKPISRISELRYIKIIKIKTVPIEP